MATPTYEYSGVCYTATADQTTFALTTSGGDSIGYLRSDHIEVRTSDDSGDTWTDLVFDTDWTFADPATSIVLTTGVAADTLVDIRRNTPMDEDWIVFQVGSLLTAGQLNEFETWQLYVDQELSDLVGNLTAPDIDLDDTDDLPEGTTNLYYTDERVETYVSGQGYIKGDGVVTRLRAGSNVTLSPTSGVGEVTISATGGGGGGGDGIPEAPADGKLYGRKDAAWAAFEEGGVTQLKAGDGVVLTPAEGTGVVTIAAAGGGGSGLVGEPGKGVFVSANNQISLGNDWSGLTAITTFSADDPSTYSDEYTAAAGKGIAINDSDEISIGGDWSNIPVLSI